MSARTAVELRSDQVGAVVATLVSMFGIPDHGNLNDPLDELVYIILSQMTTHHSYRRVFERLKATYPSWFDVLNAGPDALRRSIADAGLSKQKAPRIIAILRTLQRDFGEPSLETIRTLCDSEAERYLLSLPGVGLKTARCVMMYSLGRRVLPVDTHLARIARRMGWVEGGLSPAAMHSSLDAVVPPHQRFALHVNAISLGRTFCIASIPRCGACPVANYCEMGEAHKGMRPTNGRTLHRKTKRPGPKSLAVGKPMRVPDISASELSSSDHEAASLRPLIQMRRTAIPLGAEAYVASQAR